MSSKPFAAQKIGSLQYQRQKAYDDAYIDAIPFYLKQGFLPLSKSDEDAATRLLYFDLESVKDF